MPPAPCASLLSEACRPKRAAVSLLCEVRQGTKPWSTVRIEEISQRGFRIPWLPNCAPEFPIRVKMPGLQMLSANVRWQEGRAFGCEFAEPLHIAVFENILREAEFERRLAG